MSMCWPCPGSRSMVCVSWGLRRQQLRDSPGKSSDSSLLRDRRSISNKIWDQSSLSFVAVGLGRPSEVRLQPTLYSTYWPVARAWPQAVLASRSLSPGLSCLPVRLKPFEFASKGTLVGLISLAGLICCNSCLVLSASKQETRRWPLDIGRVGSRPILEVFSPSVSLVSDRACFPNASGADPAQECSLGCPKQSTHVIFVICHSLHKLSRGSSVPFAHPHTLNASGHA